jgi:CheY-like chemotaxis protein
MSVKQALVVDDDAINRMIATAFLKRMGWVVYEAESGQQALKLADEHSLQIVLLDISMPHMSGEEACKHLRERGFGADLAIVAYTAHAFPEDRERFLNNGFDDVLVKPLDTAQLERVITSLAPS